MLKLSLPAKRLFTLIFILTLVLIAGGAVLSLTLASLTANDILPISIGILIFTVINAGKIFLLEYQVSRLLKMEDPGKARGFAIVQGLIRFLLTAAGLLVAAVLPFDNYYALYAAIIGAFSWNIAVYSLRLMKIDVDPDANSTNTQETQTVQTAQTESDTQEDPPTDTE